MLKVIENIYHPMTIGHETGTLAVPGNIEFKPDQYTLHPLMNGEVVLALPVAPGGENSGAICHLFTRQTWTRGPAAIASERSFPSGIVWYHHETLEMTLETRDRTEWPNGQKYLTIAQCGPLGAVTTVTDQCTKVTRPA